MSNFEWLLGWEELSPFLSPWELKVSRPTGDVEKSSTSVNCHIQNKNLENCTSAVGSTLSFSVDLDVLIVGCGTSRLSEQIQATGWCVKEKNQ